MPQINIMDPNDPAVLGSLSTNPDFTVWSVVLQGGAVSLTIDEFTSSEDVKNLFNLNPPPSFIGPFLVWGELDSSSGSLSLWLSSTGERTDQFAILDNFISAIDTAAAPPNGGGTGSLFRSNKLPPSINWVLTP